MAWDDTKADYDGAGTPTDAETLDASEYNTMVTTIKAKANTASPSFTGTVTVGAGATLDVSAGTLTLANDQISGDKVEGGTINAVTINTLTGTTANVTTFDTNVAAAGVTLAGTTLAADGTDAAIDINITPKGTGEVNITKVDIDAGTIDGTDITVGAGKTLNVSAGTLTLADNQISGDKVEGGTIASTTITTLQSTNVGIGVSPTAYLHIAAGSATASTAPIKLTSGTNLTVPEAGTFEFDGTKLYFTV